MADLSKDQIKQGPNPDNGRAVKDTKQPSPSNQTTKKTDPSNDAFALDEEE